jgi:hypothetical protein
MKATLVISTIYYLLIVLVMHPIVNITLYDGIFDYEYLFKNVIFEIPIALLVGFLGNRASKYYFTKR